MDLDAALLPSTSVVGNRHVPVAALQTRCKPGLPVWSKSGQAEVRDLPTDNVRFGSLADISERIRDVRFTPNSGHFVSALSMSALCQKPTTSFRIDQFDGETPPKMKAVRRTLIAGGQWDIHPFFFKLISRPLKVLVL